MAVSYLAPIILTRRIYPVAQLSDKPTLRPMPGTDGKLWTCGRPGQTRHVGLSPEAAYRSWRHMQ